MTVAHAAAQPRILVIRRDNIGDLACTTPVFAALRQRFPDAYLCALVTTYNRAVLDGNPDLDAVFAYTKLKHRAPGQGRLALLYARLKLVRQLRALRFDYVLLATPQYQPKMIRFARWLKPRHIGAFVASPRAISGVDLAVPVRTGVAIHETEDTFRLLAPLGISGTPPALRIIPDPTQVTALEQALAQLGTGPVIGIHISARKVSQRWPVERFIDLLRALHDTYGARFVLLWAPGSADNPMHPGDDEKAEAIVQAAAGLPILAHSTHELTQLISALAVCDMVICSDGGAMHLAAGLAKPILCFFGKSAALRWRPWGVPYVLLQPPTFDAADIALEQALEGVATLRRKITA